MKYFPIILFASTIFSCNNNASNEKTFSVEYIGELGFRKTYANIQFLNNEKERDEYIEQQQKSNPILLAHPADSNFTILNRFTQLGLISRNTSDEYELLLTKFNFLTKDTFSFYNISGTKCNLKFYNDSSGRSTFFKLFSTIDTIVVDTESTILQDLNYIFLDIIPGGNKELVFLNDYYIMNGDNFYLKVYKIK